MPVITLKTVVLPAPFGPITLTISPSPTCSSRSDSASRPPNDRDTRSRLRTGLSAGFPVPFSGGAPWPAASLNRSPSALTSHDLNAPGAQQPLRPGVHHYDQDRPDQDLPGNRGLGDQPGLPDARAEIDRRHQQQRPPAAP